MSFMLYCTVLHCTVLSLIDKFSNFVNELQAIKDRNASDMPAQSAFRK